MTLHRFFATGPAPTSGRLPLAPSDVHHIRDVLRLTAGDEVLLAHAGVVTRVRLTGVGDDVSGMAEEVLASRSLPSVTLVQGIPKGDKMDTIVRQVTELGVSRVVPFAAERSVVKLDAAKAAARTERWRRIAAEAAKQSQRASVPAVEPPATLAETLSLLDGLGIVLCWEEATDAPGMAAAVAALPGCEGVAVVVGPEGGLTSAEAEAFLAAGAVSASLGDTVLRTETAGVVAPALVLYELGALGSRG